VPCARIPNSGITAPAVLILSIGSAETQHFEGLPRRTYISMTEERRVPTFFVQILIWRVWSLCRRDPLVSLSR
jgi:hypothetical protein